MSDILLVAVDHSLVRQVDELGRHRVVWIDRHNVHGGRHAGPSAETDFRPELIVVGSGVSAGDALDYGRTIVHENPNISVVLLAEPNQDLISRAAEAGLSGVLDSRLSMAELALSIDRFSMSPPSPASRVPEPHVPEPHVSEAPTPSSEGGVLPHQVIVVASPKGGVGKTMTTVNVAALLGQSAPGDVVVIDLDLQFGDVATVLDLAPTYTISDAFAFGIDDSMRLRTLLVPHKGNFHVLCGSADPAENGRVTGDQIRKLVSHYSSSFRYVVVDTPAGIHEETLASLEEATDVIFVAGLDVATLRSLRRETDVLDELSLLPPRRHLLLNRADRRSGLVERDVERIVGMPVDAVVPVSDRIALAANSGELAVLGKRRNVLRRPLQSLIRKVTDLGSQKEVTRA